MKNTDLRLEPAYQLIDKKKIDLLSIDVFDTLLWRKVPEPIDLFLLLGKRLSEEGWLIEAVDPEVFAVLRVDAERIAREKKQPDPFLPTAEVSLEEIYWSLSGIFRKITVEEMVQGKKGILSESDVSELIEIEIAFEKEFLVLDQNVANLIEYAHHKKISVILVSDTYFSETDLKRFINKEERIFVSSEQGCGKQTGLFKTVLNEMKVNPKRMLHIGDNPKSDCLAAAEHKIPFIFYTKYDKELKKIIEKEWPQEEIDKLNQLDFKQGDFGFSALRSRLSHHTAMKELSKRNRFLWRYGATVLGPIHAGFICWIYERCRELNVTQLYCLMREGKLYAELIERMSFLFPNQPLKPIELWGSRQFMRQASIFEASRSELVALMNCSPAAPFTVKTFCTMLGLDLSKISKFKKYEHVKLDDYDFADQLIDHLIANEELRYQMLQASAKKRKNYIKYLSSLVNLQETEKLVLADVGWAGSTQGMLQRMLYLERYQTKIEGFYLNTDQSSRYSLLQGYPREGFLLKAGMPKEMHRGVRRGLFILEQASSTFGEGSLKDINDQGDPITNPVVTSPAQEKEAAIVRAGISTFCEEFGKQIQQEAIQFNSKSDALRKQLQQILIRASNLPTPDEVSHFKEWGHDHVSGRSKAHLLGKDNYYEQFIGAILPGGFEPEDWRITWPAAYAAQYDENWELAAHLVRLKKLPPKGLLSHDAFPLRIFLDTGKGFGKRAKEVIELRSNANRKFYRYFKIWSIKKPIQGIQFELEMGQNKMVRFNSIRMELHRIGEPLPIALELFEEGSHKVKSKNGIIKLKHKFYDKDIYLILINFCCEMYS